MLPASWDNPWVELKITLSSSNFAATPVTRLARSRAMSRSGCVDGPWIDSSDEGGKDGSLCRGGDEGSGFEGGEAIEAGGKGADVKSAVSPAKIEGDMARGTTRV